MEDNKRLIVMNPFTVETDNGKLGFKKGTNLEVIAMPNDNVVMRANKVDFVDQKGNVVKPNQSVNIKIQNSKVIREFLDNCVLTEEMDETPTLETIDLEGLLFTHELTPDEIVSRIVNGSMVAKENEGGEIVAVEAVVRKPVKRLGTNLRIQEMVDLKRHKLKESATCSRAISISTPANYKAANFLIESDEGIAKEYLPKTVAVELPEEGSEEIMAKLMELGANVDSLDGLNYIEVTDPNEEVLEVINPFIVDEEESMEGEEVVAEMGDMKEEEEVKEPSIMDDVVMDEVIVDDEE